jgi:hypothetical protein
MAKSDSSTISERSQSWRNGVRLALDLLDEASDLGLDELAIEDDCRDGRAQNNVMLRYLDKLRALEDRNADAAFCAVLSDYLGTYADSYFGRANLERMTSEPIASAA